MLSASSTPSNSLRLRPVPSSKADDAALRYALAAAHADWQLLETLPTTCSGLVRIRSGLLRLWSTRLLVLKGRYLALLKLDARGAVRANSISSSGHSTHRLFHLSPSDSVSVDPDGMTFRIVFSEPSHTLALTVDDEESEMGALQWKHVLETAVTCAQQLPSLDLSAFRLLRQLGSGGYGTVYLARSKHTGELLALKTVRKEVAGDPSKVRDSLGRQLYGETAKRVRLQQVTRHVDYMINERSALELLQGSPFLAKMHLAFQDRDAWHVGLEWVSGGDLYSHLKAQPTRSFPEPVVRVWAAELVSALEYMHSQGFGHRDIKAENVLLDERGHVRLIDYGFAKNFATTENGRSNSFCGTKYYLAPEMIKGDGHGVAIDWWALGILLYEMLTGYPPFNMKHRPTLYRMILNDEVRFDTPEASRLSQSARSLISELLQKDPSRRLGARPFDALASASGAAGLSEIRGHSFFEGIDWHQVDTMSLRPLFVPAKPDDVTASELSAADLKAPAATAPEHVPLYHIRGFSFYNPRSGESDVDADGAAEEEKAAADVSTTMIDDKAGLDLSPPDLTRFATAPAALLPESYDESAGGAGGALQCQREEAAAAERIRAVLMNAQLLSVPSKKEKPVDGAHRALSARNRLEGEVAEDDAEYRVSHHVPSVVSASISALALVH